MGIVDKELGDEITSPVCLLLEKSPTTRMEIMLKKNEGGDEHDQDHGSNDGRIKINPEKIQKSTIKCDGINDLLFSSNGHLHIQVLKIKEEDLHIGEGMANEVKIGLVQQITSQLLWPRSILPSSPLGGNKSFNALTTEQTGRSDSELV